MLLLHYHRPIVVVRQHVRILTAAQIQGARLSWFGKRPVKMSSACPPLLMDLHQATGHLSMPNTAVCWAPCQVTCPTFIPCILAWEYLALSALPIGLCYLVRQPWLLIFCCEGKRDGCRWRIACPDLSCCAEHGLVLFDSLHDYSLWLHEGL